MKLILVLFLFVFSCAPMQRGHFLVGQSQLRKGVRAPINRDSLPQYDSPPPVVLRQGYPVQNVDQHKRRAPQYLSEAPAAGPSVCDNLKFEHLNGRPTRKPAVHIYDNCTLEAVRKGAMAGFEPFPQGYRNANFKFLQVYNNSVPYRGDKNNDGRLETVLDLPNQTIETTKSALKMARDGDPFLLNQPLVQLPRGVSVLLELPKDRCKPGRISFGPLPSSVGLGAGKHVTCTALGRGRTNWPYENVYRAEKGSRSSGYTLSGMPCSYVKKYSKRGATPTGTYKVKQVRVKGPTNKELYEWGKMPSIELLPLNLEPNNGRGGFFVHTRHESLAKGFEKGMDHEYVSSHGCPRLNPSCQRLLNLYLTNKVGSTFKVVER